MTLADLIHAVDTLSSDDLETLATHIQHQRGRRVDQGMSGDRHPKQLDIEAIMQTFAELADGFSETDLDELDWAMNNEFIEPLDNVE